ncbi:MAG: AraC family transcriptional regulator [Defluviitaleaceae bacterium]|nr:AraC family transcriptional regulator [Defluviitaleaceae bacterium]
MDWLKGIQNAIHYIEDNITEELDYDDIAKQANVSSFHFQRAFGILCGFTLGEYIRNRRLTLAGMELSSGNSKVIDVAVKYCYDSPDSFTKAFSRFHGIYPSSAKKEGTNLKSITSEN